MSGLVLSLCDRTGVMVQPWLDAGYRCTIVDVQHAPGVETDDLLTRVGADLRSWLPPLDEYEIVFAFPPCTNLASSGARWFKDKGLVGLIDGLELVERCRLIAEWSGAPWMIENPNGTLSTYWRQPDFRFDPCEFGGYLNPPGDAYTKRTCLWTGNDFPIPRHKAVTPIDGSKMHRLPPSPERGDLRSVTPAGFARAVFEAAHERRPRHAVA